MAAADGEPDKGISRNRDQAESWRQEEIARELDAVEFESEDDREEAEDELDRRFFTVKLAV